MAQGNAKPGTGARLHLPVPEQFKLSNGLSVLFSERRGLPLGGGKFVLRAGGAGESG